MATSGIIGTVPSGTGPYLQIHWQRLGVDIANNRSKVRLDLRLYARGRISFSNGKTASLDGSTGTFTGTFNASNANMLIRTRDIWITHNNDGTRSYSTSGYLDIKISYSGSWIERLSVSGTISLDAIPRRSGITAFDFGDRRMHPNEENTVTLGINSSHPSFSHQIFLYYGNKQITNWTHSANTTLPTTLNLSLANVRYILNLNNRNQEFMLRLELETFSNGVSMGRSGSWERKATVHSDVTPSISNLTAYIYGERADSVAGKFVEGFSKVGGSFDIGGSYGATISLAEASIRRLTGEGDDDQTMPGYPHESNFSGVIPETLRHGGWYRIVGYVRDSRGRVTRDYTDFYVEYYTPPRILEFSVERREGDGRVLDILTKTEWTSLDNGNNLSMVVEHKLVSQSTWTDLYHYNDKSGTWEKGEIIDNVSEDDSYDFRLRIKDGFKSEGSITITVGTVKTALDVFEDIGIGVGKKHEFGTLDVDGDIYNNGEFLDNIFHAGNSEIKNTPRGNYLKLPNGLLLQWGRQSGTISTSAFGNVQYGQLIATEFPVAFVSTPDLVIPTLYDNNHFGIAYDSVNSSRVYRWLIYGATVRNGYSLAIHWYAIGRWK